MIMIKPATFEEWLVLNRSSIGGSKAATIIGANPYETPYQLWERMTGRTPEVETTWPMIVGNFLEDAVAKMYEHESGTRVIKASADPVVYVHTEHDFIKGTPDRRIILQGNVKAVLEIKTTIANYDHDTIPASWFVQPMLYMGLMEMKKAVLCWFHLPTRELKWREIDFDRDMYEALVSDMVDFWNNYIVPDLPPPSINSSDVLHKYPNHTPDTWIDAASYTAVNLLEAYSRIDEIERAIKPLEAEKDAISEQIKMVIANKEGIAYNSETLWTYKTNKPSEVVDTKKLKAEHPKIYTDYVMFKPGARVLRRKKQ